MLQRDKPVLMVLRKAYVDFQKMLSYPCLNIAKWLLVTDLTLHFASFLMELGHKLNIEKCTLF